MSAALPELRTSEAIAEEIEEAQAALKAIRVGPGAKEEIDELHERLRALNAELAGIDGPKQFVGERPAICAADLLALEIDELHEQLRRTPVETRMGEVRLLHSQLNEKQGQATRQWRDDFAAAESAYRDGWDSCGRFSVELEDAIRELFEIDAAELSPVVTVEKKGLVNQRISEIRASERAAELARREAARPRTPVDDVLDEIRVLEARRVELHDSALVDEDAAQELSKVETEIGALRVRECALYAEAARQARIADIEAGRAAEEAERERLGRVEKVGAERKAALSGVLVALGALGERVSEFVATDRAYLTETQGRYSFDEKLVERVLIALYDAGISRRAFAYLPPNAFAARIRDEYPIPVAVEPKPKKACPVCVADSRGDIETALTDKTASLRDLAKAHGISKSAISRHHRNCMESA